MVVLLVNAVGHFGFALPHALHQLARLHRLDIDRMVCGGSDDQNHYQGLKKIGLTFNEN